MMLFATAGDDITLGDIAERINILQAKGYSTHLHLQDGRATIQVILPPTMTARELQKLVTAFRETGYKTKVIL